MGNIVYLIGALIAVTVLGPLLKVLIAAVAGKQIGAAALAKQPDHIHLSRTDSNAPQYADAFRAVAEALAGRGFVDAGVYTITEMPGVIVQLLAHAGEGYYAAVYEHPRAGVWLDLVARYQDGTSVTYSTSHPTALKPRPGHVTIHLPGQAPNAVLERALAQRPRRAVESVSVGQAVSVFEQAYAESIAYRKQAGISTTEVINTARKAA